MNSSSKAAAALLMAATLAPAAFAAKSGGRTMVMEDTVAMVNGSPIMLSEYQKEAATALDYWSKSNPAALADPAAVAKIREGTLEELITRELLVQQAKKLGIKVRSREVDNAVDEIKARFKTDEQGRPLDAAGAEKAFHDQLDNEGLDYGQFRERLEHQLMARKVIEQEVKAKVTPPGDQEVRAYFDKINAFIATGSTEAPKGMSDDEADALLQAARQVKALSSERVRVSRILIRVSQGAGAAERKRALDAAQDIEKRLKAGGDFAAIARKESEDPDSADRGGDLGYLVRGVAPEAMEKAAFSLDVGQTSKPILTDGGFNIIRVTEKRAAEAPDFDKFKPDLANFMANMKFQKALADYVKGLRDHAVIERHLPKTP
jgi:parvulin-like peptidyl-prolyl isomerase